MTCETGKVKQGQRGKEMMRYIPAARYSISARLHSPYSVAHSSASLNFSGK